MLNRFLWFFVATHHERGENPASVEVVLLCGLASASRALTAKPRQSGSRMDEFEGFPEDVRGHLSEQGSDLTLPHNLDLYLYYPAEAPAQEVAAAFVDSPMESEVIESDDHWLCLVQCRLVPSVDGLAAIANLMRTVHDKFGGDFDGWHAEIVTGTTTSD
jgi:Regulator of ribonuclease activity B